VLEEAAVLGDYCARGEAAWGSGGSACHVNSVDVRHLADGCRRKCVQRNCREIMRIEHLG